MIPRGINTAATNFYPFCVQWGDTISRGDSISGYILTGNTVPHGHFFTRGHYFLRGVDSTPAGNSVPPDTISRGDSISCYSARFCPTGGLGLEKIHQNLTSRHSLIMYQFCRLLILSKRSATIGWRGASQEHFS